MKRGCDVMLMRRIQATLARAKKQLAAGAEREHMHRRRSQQNTSVKPCSWTMEQAKDVITMLLSVPASAAECLHRPAQLDPHIDTIT